ncbi:MAG TPA: QueT transporter family protein [Tetragenococcus sp.]|nr:QueT transporter family protein [Tetragenococcus sp.]
MQNKKVRVLTVNAIIMALYVALSFISPLRSGAIQFRMSESLNHLVVFNRKMLWGVFGGVLVFNLFFGEGPLDVVFGGAQTLLALLATAALEKKIPNVKARLAINVVFFTVSMFMIALMLTLTAELPFWMTYLTTALSELVIMSLSAPVMYYVNEKLNFADKI